MPEMTPERWENTCRYLEDVFHERDPMCATLSERANQAGLPDIAISPDVGRLLTLLASMCGDGGGARLALELGTLAGYSGSCIARGLNPAGRLITVEPEPRHADFARKHFDAMGFGGRVEIRRTTGIEVLPKLLAEFGPESFDFVFFDAIKREYPEYFRLARPLIKRGGLLVADNALGSSFWIDDPPGNPERDGADALNRAVAADAGFVSSCVPIRQGVLIARRV